MPPDIEFYRGIQKYHESIRSTQAFKKFLNYIDALNNKAEFVSELKWFRGHIENVETNKKLPINGLPIPKNKEEHSKNTSKYDYIYDEKISDYFNIDEYNKREKMFREKYDLDIFGDAFDFLLYYGSVKPMEKFGYCSFLEIIDLDLMLELGLTNGFVSKNSKEDVYNLMKNYAKSTPIAILIHPYMSERDIIDAVRKTYKTAILPIQEDHKKSSVNLQIVREKSNKLKERDSFIYDYRHLPIKELTELVNTEFRDGKHYDYTYIQTILKREMNKRK